MQGIVTLRVKRPASVRMIEESVGFLILQAFMTLGALELNG